VRFSGRVYKEGKWWLAEIPVLEAMTQGRSRKEALEMVSDMMESMINKKGFKVEVLLGAKNEFEVGSKDIKPLIRLLLQRKRQTSGLSLSVCLGIGSSQSPSVQISCLPPCHKNHQPNDLSAFSNSFRFIVLLYTHMCTSAISPC